MGEIRSTLDIIMEKTKGLTMSEEEKKAFKEQEMEGKVKGLIQKFLDGGLDMEKLKMEMTVLAEKDGDMIKLMIRKESIPRIEIEEDNAPVLRILEETAGLDTTSIREVLEDFEVRLEQEKGVREKKMIKSLDKKGISGVAVIPNMEADLEWGQRVSEMRNEFQKKLGSYTK